MMRSLGRILFLFCSLQSSNGFSVSNSGLSSPHSRFLGRSITLVPKSQRVITTTKGSSTTSLRMFLGSDGGILGVGTPELATIVLVGYFILGPSDLYKLAKEIGKAVQNFRTLSSEATKTFESSMESQLQLEEIRKTQRELNDAFSFRRSINVDPNDEAFTTTTTSEKVGAEPILSRSTMTDDNNATKEKKRIRRRKKPSSTVVDNEQQKQQQLFTDDSWETGVNGENIPDLDMNYAFDQNTKSDWNLEANQGTNTNDWFLESENPSTTDDMDETVKSAQNARFQAQVQGNWNDSILDNEDQLSPLAKVMERLALLEEEKAAQVFRLEEEFRERANLEETFYRQKRALLEDAATEIQANVYSSMTPSTTPPTTTTTTTSQSNPTLQDTTSSSSSSLTPSS